MLIHSFTTVGGAVVAGAVPAPAGAVVLVPVPVPAQPEAD